MSKRLPRRVRIGPYRVDIVLVSQGFLREEMEDDDNGVYHGCWVPTHGIPMGRIYVLETLPSIEKWNTFWHELNHALTDLRDWDMESRKAGQ